MKIGILTFHRAYNYGAVLQCYALKAVLSSLGYNVNVIDYRQPEIEYIYQFHHTFSNERYAKMSLVKKVAYIVYCVFRDCRNFIIHAQKKQAFESFQKMFLNLSEPCNHNIPSDYDAYIIGSDMLWSDECMKKKFDKVYLGEFEKKDGAKTIGYAISGTPASFERLGIGTGFSFIRNFDSISIREKSLSEIVSKYIGTKVQQCIDPTLLASKELWSEILNKKWASKKYVVTYYLRPKDTMVDNKVRRMAKENGLEIINIDVRQSAKPISVQDFISIIAHAQYVVTDSFHGIIFSLIFERPFHALKFNDPHDARYVDILERIGLKDNAVYTDFDPFIPHIDYKKATPKIAEFRKSSLNYLATSL